MPPCQLKHIPCCWPMLYLRNSAPSLSGPVPPMLCTAKARPRSAPGPSSSLMAAVLAAGLQRRRYLDIADNVDILLTCRGRGGRSGGLGLRRSPARPPPPPPRAARTGSRPRPGDTASSSYHVYTLCVFNCRWHLELINIKHEWIINDSVCLMLIFARINEKRQKASRTSIVIILL